jgi:hypothetical protein
MLVWCARRATGAEFNKRRRAQVADLASMTGHAARSPPVPFGRSLQSGGVLVVRLCRRRQMNPRMSATVVDRILRWRKAWVGEGAHGDSHGRLFVTFFGVEHGCPADRAEPELELVSLVTDTNVLGCGAKDLIGGGEGSQHCKDTAGPLLTGEAVANADSQRFTLNFNPQLPAATRGRSRTHSAPPAMLSANRLRVCRRTFGLAMPRWNVVERAPTLGAALAEAAAALPASAPSRHTANRAGPLSRHPSCSSHFATTWLELWNIEYGSGQGTNARS